MYVPAVFDNKLTMLLRSIWGENVGNMHKGVIQIYFNYIRNPESTTTGYILRHIWPIKFR